MGGSHILRRGATQSFRMYIIVSGECTATDYLDKTTASSSLDVGDSKKERQARPVTLRSPAYFNEEGLIRLQHGDNDQEDRKKRSRESIIYSKSFSKNVIKKYK